MKNIQQLPRRLLIYQTSTCRTITTITTHNHVVFFAKKSPSLLIVDEWNFQCYSNYYHSLYSFKEINNVRC